MRDVARDWTRRLCLAHLDAAGAGYTLPWRGGEDLRPTSEFNSHLAIHHTNAEIGREARVVVHTHPTEIIAMTHLAQFKSADALNKVLWSMMPEAVFTFPEGVGFAPYQMTGTDALEQETVRVVRQHRVCVWEKHGCLAVGADVQSAFDVLDTVNKCARIFFLCKHAGQDPEGIPPHEVEAIRKAFVKEY
jgi:rhamnulose-1-phosphate aldolase